MVALTQPRQTKERNGQDFARLVKIGAKLIEGGMTAIDVDKLVPASANPALVVVGVARSNAAEGTLGRYRRGLFPMANSASADLITPADINKPCYAVDDQTVAKTSATNTRPVAGTIRDVDGDGVWVEF